MLRLLVKDTAIYAVGVVVSRMVGFVMIPIYTRVLTPEDYGILEAISRLVDILGLLLALGIAASILRYYNQPTEETERDRLVSTSLILMLAMTAIGLAILLPSSGWLGDLLFGHSQHTLLVRIAVGGMLLSNLATLPLTLFRAARRPWRFTAFSLAQLITALTLNIIFVVIMRLGVMGALLSGLVTALVWGSVLSVGLIRQVGLSYDRGYAGRLLGYGLPLVPASLATFVLNFSDRFFLVRLAPIDELGLYSLAYRFAMLVSVFLGVVINAWWPWAFRVAEQPHFRRTLKEGGGLVLTALAVAAMAVILFSGPAIRLVAAKDFFPAAQYVPPLAVAYWFFATAAPFSLGSRLAERTDTIAMANGVAAVVCILMSFWLIPEYGAWGAAWVTVAAFVIRSAAILYASHAVMPLDQDWGALGWSVIGLAGASVYAMWEDLPLVLDSVFRGLIWVGFSLLLSAYYAHTTGKLGSSIAWLRQAACSPGRLFEARRDRSGLSD